MTVAEVHPTIRVIVVNYNGGVHLARAMRALAAQTVTEFEAVVVDNASTDGSIEDALPAGDDRFRLLPQANNIGFAAANNRGAAGATAEFLVLLNSDAFPEPDWLENLVAAARANADVAMFGSTQLRADNPNTFDGVGDGYFIGGVSWRAELGRPSFRPYPGGGVFAPCAAAAMYRRAIFEFVDGFDERYFCYSEDIDLAFRIRLAGGHCLQVPEAVVHHVGGGSSGGHGPFSSYHIARNQLWTFIKNVPGPVFWLMLPVHLLLQLAYILRAIRSGTAGARLRGLRDALCALGPIWRTRRVLQRTRKASRYELLRAMAVSPYSWLMNRQHRID